MTDTKAFVETLFDGYERTAALSDLVEELAGNLDDKIASEMKKGMARSVAFDKAKAELGDVSALAGELSLKLRRDIIAERYLGGRKYLTARRVVAYVLFGLLFLFGIVTAAIVYFERAIGGGFQPNAVRMPGLFGVLLLFVTAAVAGFTFLGVTQETADLYPMRKRRAVFYTIAVGVITFGLVLFPLTYFATGLGLMEAIATLLPFAIPGAGLLAFLCLTEAGRLKPWAAERAMAEMRGAHEMLSGADAARFSLYSGAVWIFALGAFVTLGFLIGFRYSWLAFVFAVAVQLVVQALCMGRKAVSPGQHAVIET
jgi:MFS family permease